MTQGLVILNIYLVYNVHISIYLKPLLFSDPKTSIWAMAESPKKNIIPITPEEYKLLTSTFDVGDHDILCTDRSDAENLKDYLKEQKKRVRVVDKKTQQLAAKERERTQALEKEKERAQTLEKLKRRRDNRKSQKESKYYIMEGEKLVEESGDCSYKKCRRVALHICSGCRKVAYCSSRCHLLDWEFHRGECVSGCIEPPLLLFAEVD